MKKFHNAPKNADQSSLGVTKSKKHEVNLRKNSTIYFQIGLILCLLAVHGLFEMQFQTKLIDIGKVPPELLDPDQEYKNYVVKKAETQQKVVEKKIVFRGQKPKVVPNETPELKVTKFKPPVIASSKVPTGIIKSPAPNVEVNSKKAYPAMTVEQVPIYPGCEKATTNEERLKCMSQKLSKLIQRKFDTGVGERAGLTGIQKINVQFTIDNTGMVTNVITRAPNKLLENEAIKVMGKVPTMQPGKQRDKPVSVLYSFPIIFKIQDH